MTAKNRNPMTEKGYKALVEEHNLMLKIERPSVIQAISEAREHGDLSENAEYKAAKEKQRHIETRIAYLERTIDSAEIIKNPTQTDRVQFGSKVKLFDIQNDTEVVYVIVGDYEAAIKSGKISVFSPVAKSMIGKAIGDCITVSTPNGNKEYEIIDITIPA